ncbi:Bli1p NDAI_0C00660 [Naumovozyma dairenensis CBS 421]|uniref:Biogenesis of lysosome-related organelles complex 1 subunit BLI1 n=1 Tax=Naumovozyma dairenensis (strain ATCC 10597 / BCRC 20456 / CBS 421 / NBRC 0211 / NRRL Y-12639) TaxID=1071378 RepID=G0W7G6_NAUDC|nr:hypothetical protein NDAI_0C00660 [Naumovozyma dairenensis CBS 421]CCD23727.1 hypothetical protein NDAI_0C00660 [Naumovozyma dairenensis CBS 421]
MDNREFSNSSGGKNKFLQTKVEACVNSLQELLDTEAARSISTFAGKTGSNKVWLEELSAEYKLKPDRKLDAIGELYAQQLKQLDDLEEKSFIMKIYVMKLKSFKKN